MFIAFDYSNRTNPSRLEYEYRVVDLIIKDMIITEQITWHSDLGKRVLLSEIVVSLVLTIRKVESHG